MTKEQEEKLREIADKMNEDQLQELLRYAKSLKAGD